MSTYTFDTFSLAIAVSPSELKGLMSGSQKAILKNTRSPFRGGTKCYLYETKADGGRGCFVAIGELERASFCMGDEEMYRDCGLTQVDAEKTITSRHSGIVFYIKNIVEVSDPEILSNDIRQQFLIDAPKTVTQMKR